MLLPAGAFDDWNMTTHTICTAFLSTVEKHGDAIALRWREDDAYRTMTWSELSAHVARVAGVLQARGVQQGNRVTILLSNRPEFFIIDLATLFCGATPVSIYLTSSKEQIAEFEKRTQSVLTVAEDNIRELCTEQQEPLDLHVAAEAVHTSDIATIIFTSGTTSSHKGVMITHANIASMVLGAKNATAFDFTGKRVVSYLPFAHVAERNLSYYLPVFFGMEVTTCPSPSLLSGYLLDTRPHLFLAVPRVWEKMYVGVHAKLAPHRLRRMLLQLILHLRWLGMPIGESVLRKLRAQLGLDQALIVASAAAPLDANIAYWFTEIGLPFSEIYGLSETCGPITWTPHNGSIGTVGKPLAGNTVALLPDGEIVVQGTSVFAGYLDDPAATNDAFVNGWFCTGDLGRFTTNGELVITGRKKDLIITAGGKNISPALLEARLESSAVVAHACVIGDQRPFLIAVLAVESHTDDTFTTRTIARLVDEINESVSQPERIKKYIVVDASEWTPSSPLLTATLKVRRSGVLTRYANEINSLYNTRKVA